MKLQITTHRKWTGHKIVEGGVVPKMDQSGFENGEAVELWIGEYGLGDIVEPIVSVLLTPEQARRMAMSLEAAAFAAIGLFKNSHTRENDNGNENDGFIDG